MRYLYLNLLMFYCSNTYCQVSLNNDEFINACSKYEWSSVNETEGWNATHLELHDVDVSNEGSMTMIPYTTAWYADYRSNLIYKELAGDFVFSAKVEASNRAETGIPNGSTYSLAGIMIRAPKDLNNGISGWQTDQENYVFLALGFAATNHPTCQGCPGPHFEVKNTINSASMLRVASIDTASAIIRMVRKDDDVIVMYQLPGQNWQVHERYQRPDLPDTVQVGFVTYSDWPKVSTYNFTFHNSNTLSAATTGNNGTSNANRPFSPDLIGKFSYARFNEIDLEPNQDLLDLYNPNEVSDIDMIAWFGYDSEYSGFHHWKIWKGLSSVWTDPANWSENSIPLAQDSIIIPNCSCPEMISPIIDVGNYTYSALHIEDGASLQISPLATMTLNLNESNSKFENQGVINNEGDLNIMNSTGKMTINLGQIHCIGNGEYRIE